MIAARMRTVPAHARTPPSTSVSTLREEEPAVQIDATLESVPEVRGLAETWWRSKDSLIALCRGEAVSMDALRGIEAHVYGDLDEWGLHRRLIASALTTYLRRVQRVWGH
ncbi:hypothetical protein ACFRIC_07285 [Streptomyces sp. NPDC056738]|uniref:hypothetical protein n=1 Tax=Streptomyces sp. NPDC056738 TaxID=3345933 RepID=UPI0036B34E4D